MSTVHASAVLVGARAVLIRGPSGAGKSRLALALIDAAAAGMLPFARLVADDRVQLDVICGRVLARPPASLGGMIEVHGLGIRRLPFEPLAVIGWVVDLAAADAERLPATPLEAVISGVPLPRLAVLQEVEPLPLVLAALRTRPFEAGTAADIAAQHRGES